MPKNSKGWDARRRAQQALNCRKTKPEQRATGPRTGAGKTAYSQNALKSGIHSANILKLRRLLRQQRKNLRDLGLLGG